MKDFKIILIVLSSFLILSCQDNKSNAIGKSNHIERQNFNKNWKFKLLENSESNQLYFENEIATDNWEHVQLPHTPKLEPKIVNNQWQGICWYRKAFTIPENMVGKKLFLKFEGAMNIAEVWVNNKKLIEHHGGYLPFVIDFSDVVNLNVENIVAVKLNNKDNPRTGPKPLELLDFNTYGGIYRNVWLIAKNQLYITDPILENKVASGGVFVTYPKVDEEEAIIQIKTHIKNSNTEETPFLVKNTLMLKDLEVAIIESEQQILKQNLDVEVFNKLTIKNPKLWSPDTPDLYHLKTEIISNGIIIDKEIITIGIKTMKFVGQDFYLNGKKTFLRGVNRHQEYPHVGYALSDRANYRDAKKIKDAGFDYVRLSHYPQSPSFMDACDELGLITIDAILGWQYFSEDKAFQEHVFQTAKDLIRRDRNHASVLAWEVSLNESWMPETFINSLNKIAKEEYPGDQCYTAGWQSYGFDIYLQARQHRLSHYDKDLKKPYNVSEYGDWEYYAMNAGLNQNSWGDLLQEERSSRQLRSAGEHALLQQAKNIQEAHNDNLSTPAFADGYWAVYDYNRGYAKDLEASGIMDIYRLPKPAYYFFKSQRHSNTTFGKPMVHIANNWSVNSPLDISIFSNCDAVELFLNGKSLGRQEPDVNRISDYLNHPPFTFVINKFEKGTLEAHGFINNKLEVKAQVITPEEPSKIEIVVDDSGIKPLSNANDMVFVYAKIQDNNHTLLANNNMSIYFEIEGDAQIIGVNPVVSEAGIATVLLKVGNTKGDIQITASSKNFTANHTLTIN